MNLVKKTFSGLGSKGSVHKDFIGESAKIVEDHYRKLLLQRENQT